MSGEDAGEGVAGARPCLRCVLSGRPGGGSVSDGPFIRGSEGKTGMEDGPGAARRQRCSQAEESRPRLHVGALAPTICSRLCRGRQPYPRPCTREGPRCVRRNLLRPHAEPANGRWTTNLFLVVLDITLHDAIFPYKDSTATYIPMMERTNTCFS